jgi:hypothetical protein
MKVEEYNCLTVDTACAPNYTPNPRHRCIQAYYALNNDVILIGEADPCYIYWLSVTKLDADAINRQIVDHLLHMEPTVFGHESDVLQKTEYTMEQLRSFYSAPVNQADDIILHLQEAKERCKSLETKVKFVQDLQHYLKVLSYEAASPAAFYRKHKSKITRLRSMRYLYCSDNPEVRDLYEQLDKCCANLYNAYMTEARG